MTVLFCFLLGYCGHDLWQQLDHARRLRHAKQMGYPTMLDVARRLDATRRRAD